MIQSAVDDISLRFQRFGSCKVPEDVSGWVLKHNLRSKAS